MMGSFILMISTQNKTKTPHGNVKAGLARTLTGESQHPTQLLSGS